MSRLDAAEMARAVASAATAGDEPAAKALLDSREDLRRLAAYIYEIRGSMLDMPEDVAAIVARSGVRPGG